MFQLVVLPTLLARPEPDHGYQPKCRTVYKTQYKAGIIKLPSEWTYCIENVVLVRSVSVVAILSFINFDCNVLYISPIYVVN